MTKTDTPAINKRNKRKPVEKIDLDRPFFLTFRQTESSTIVTSIQGDNSEDFGLANVLKKVNKEVERIKAPIVVFGPQIGTIKPPEPAPPVFVGMDFAGKG